ncbi:MAG: N-formylglutamate amidohydrolase [Planctomycetes bacterium]|nr:N-formylglutamate amidohydrolase [Planctomycetota bacterium]
MFASARRLALLAAALGGLAATVIAAPPLAPAPRTAEKPPTSDLVTTQEGKLPVILSAPHGGTHDVPGVAPRKGDGLPVGGSGFFAGRDGNTEELAHAVSAAIAKKTGKKPYLVVAKFHRKYIDANRPPEIAYEDARAKPTYDAYRQALAAYCRAVKKEYGRGLLLDIHGQGAMKDAVIRGTKDGKTVSLLTQRYGEKAHTGPNSFFGLLAGNGCKVFPERLAEKEYASLNGGNIVQTYGSGEYGIDAIQLEFGGEYREKAKLNDTADRVAATVDQFAKLYLNDK